MPTYNEIQECTTINSATHGAFTSKIYTGACSSEMRTEPGMTPMIPPMFPLTGNTAKMIMIVTTMITTKTQIFNRPLTVKWHRVPQE